MNTPQKDEVFSFSLFVMLDEIALLQHHVESKKRWYGMTTKATRNNQYRKRNEILLN